MPTIVFLPPRAVHALHGYIALSLRIAVTEPTVVLEVRQPYLLLSRAQVRQFDVLLSDVFNWLEQYSGRRPTPSLETMLTEYEASEERLSAKVRFVSRAPHLARPAILWCQSLATDLSLDELEVLVFDVGSLVYQLMESDASCFYAESSQQKIPLCHIQSKEQRDKFGATLCGQHEARSHALPCCKMRQQGDVCGHSERRETMQKNDLARKAVEPMITYRLYKSEENVSIVALVNGDESAYTQSQFVSNVFYYYAGIELALVGYRLLQGEMLTFVDLMTLKRVVL